MNALVDRMKSKVLTVMAEDGRTRFPGTAALLGLLSHAYGRAVRIRSARFADGRARSRRLPCKVVSVGNLTTGGTGKTPMTLHLAELIRQFGYRVAVISRGYRGRAEYRGGVVSDGRRVILGPAAAGDEPFMMAASLSGIPVVVGRDRYRAGMTAIREFGSQVVVLDDAFQHRQLSRDLDIVLLDERRPLGNGHLLPRGSLREPVAALKRADAIVLTRSRERPGGLQTKPFLLAMPDRPLFRCAHLPRGCWVEPGRAALPAVDVARALVRDPLMLRGHRVLVFSGIAGNRGFLQTVIGLGASVADIIAFGDHHRYSRADCRLLCRRAKELGSDAMVTTYKDYVKIAHRADWPVKMAVIDIRLCFGSAASEFDALVRKFVEI